MCAKNDQQHHRGRRAADPPAFCRRCSAGVPHAFRRRSARDPHRCRTGAAPVPHRCRRRSAANPHGYPQTARKAKKKLGVPPPVFFGVVVLLGVFLCFLGVFLPEDAAPHIRRRFARDPHCAPHLLRTCSALAKHLCRTCAALWTDLRRGVLCNTKRRSATPRRIRGEFTPSSNQTAELRVALARAWFGDLLPVRFFRWPIPRRL